ncbi:MAG: hypothetical protein KatS3mg050_1304 [Litorilinea sp.]|nr:MAG: hypothetical protein KatS3mg050_1304 [Litorilinea sp.]
MNRSQHLSHLSEPQSAELSRQPGLFALLLLGLLVLGPLVLFLWPWGLMPLQAEPSLARYAPGGDGHSSLSELYDRSGTLIGWRSQNQAVVPTLNIYTDLPAGPRELIDRRYFPASGDNPAATTDAQAIMDVLAQVTVSELRIHTLTLDGTLTRQRIYLVEDPEGQFLVAIQDLTSGQEQLYDPPLLLLPADLLAGSGWSSQGQVSGQVDYMSQGRVLATGPHGAHADCLEVEQTLTLKGGQTEAYTLITRTHYCAGVGPVESVTVQEGGAYYERALLVSVDEAPPSFSRLPSPPPVAPPPDLPPGVENWRLVRFGRALPVNISGAGTVPPAWLPTDPPLLLATGYNGDLLAFTQDGQVAWRFHPQGTIYGAPAFDPATGVIYFGASDKRLYAVDSQGLFRWSYRAGDNVATRPAVVHDRVIFGSEDRTVVGLDTVTGALAWQVQVGGPVVSDPAVDGSVAIMGADDGAVYGLDVDTGTIRWTFATEGPVEAGVVVRDGIVYVASRDGTLTALEAQDGQERWQVTLGTGGGSAFRTAPAVGAEAIWLVDAAGTLFIVDRERGRQRWESTEWVTYVGPPLALADQALVPRKDGKIDLMDATGTRLAQWDASTARLPVDPPPAFSLGPAAGGDSLWLVDDGAVIYRLAPHVAPDDMTSSTGGGSLPAALTLRWSQHSLTTPFHGTGFFQTPISYRGGALVMEHGNHVYQLDPDTGQARYLGAFGQGTSALVEPVVVQDTLLAVAGSQLHALSLPDLQPRWTAPGQGVTWQPPVAAGDMVLWLEGSAAEGLNQGVLHALRLADGQVQWQATLAPFYMVGGAVVAGETVYVSTPPGAYDLTTGVQRWQAALPGPGLGGPGLSADGHTLYVGLVHPEGNDGQVAALDTADGAARWVVTLPGDALNPVDRLWPDGEMLVVPGLEGTLYGLDARDGQERWRYTPPGPRLGTITVAEGRVWLALQDGAVWGLDVASGRPVAHFQQMELNLAQMSFAQRPALVRETLLAPLGIMLLGFDVPPAELPEARP